MKRVLVTHAGGRLGIGICRNLMASPEPVHVVGVDADRFEIARAVADERRLVPRADDECFIPVLREIARETGADFVWPCHDNEVAALARNVRRLGFCTFVPPFETVALCHDKMRSYERLRSRGVPVPRTIPISTPRDLKNAFRELGPELWIRATRGVGGKGALPVCDFQRARAWIDIHEGWGEFMAAERLPGQRTCLESVWRHGRMYFAQGNRSFKIGFSNLTLSGVTGLPGVINWTSSEAVRETGLQAVHAVCDEPHGIFSVDMVSDADGQPRVTEINIGRFASGGSIHARRSGVNVPHIVAQLAMDEEPGFEAPLVNALPEDLIVVHGMNTESIEFSLTESDQFVERLERQRGGMTPAGVRNGSTAPDISARDPARV